MDTPRYWIAIGLTGQALFFMRFFLQWIASERAKKSVVPRGFWLISLLGSAFVLAYAFYRRDAVFVLGMLPSVFIYGKNMFLKGPSPRSKLIPLAAAFAVFVLWAALKEPYVGNLAWAAIGFCGSLVWMSRFIVQWWVSERRGETTLPVAFWVMCLVGSALLLAYSIYRKDPVFIPGFAIGYLVYSRNLYLLRREQAAASDS